MVVYCLTQPKALQLFAVHNPDLLCGKSGADSIKVGPERMLGAAKFLTTVLTLGSCIYRTGPINSRNLLQNDLVNSSRLSCHFAQVRIFGGFLFTVLKLQIHGENMVRIHITIHGEPVSSRSK
jgi:hypothetical protein